MNELKEIWSQLDKISTDLKVLAEPNASLSVYEQLQKEQDLRKKSYPFLVLLLLLTPVVLVFLTQQTNPGTFDWKTITGISLISLAGITISWLSQIVKFPLQQFEHDRTSMEFLVVVKNKLDQAKKMLIIGVVLQLALLTLGLMLLILPQIPADQLYTYLFLLTGFMLSLTGIVVGGSISFFNKHYQGIYTTIRTFTKE